MSVIIVESGTVGEDTICSEFNAGGVLLSLVKFRIVGVDCKVFELEAAKVIPWILVAVIPSRDEIETTCRSVRLNKGLGVFDLGFGIPAFDEKAVFGIGSGEDGAHVGFKIY